MDVFGSSEKNPQDILKQALIDFFKNWKKSVPVHQNLTYQDKRIQILIRKKFGDTEGE